MASKLNIDKINLQLLIGLDTDQEGGTTTSSDNFIGEVRRLEDEREGTLELLEDGFDQLGEREAFGTALRVENVLGEDSDGLGIGVALELVATFLKDLPQLGTVGDNAVMDENEFRVRIRTNRVTITFRRGTMSRPSCMRDRDLGDGGLFEIEVGSSNLLAETGHFANLLEVLDGSGFIAVNNETSRVVSAVLLTSKTSTENFENLLAAL